MPTAAKLVASILLAGLGFVAAGRYVQLMPEGSVAGNLVAICVGLGAVVGWLVLGRRAGHGLGAGTSAGLQAAVMLVASALAVFSVERMIRRAMAGFYGSDILRAVIGVFENMYEFGMRLADSQLLGILIIGGLVAGLVTELVNRRWS
jgi:drug/metabolite transporter (DMT)-like permease